MQKLSVYIKLCYFYWHNLLILKYANICLFGEFFRKLTKILLAYKKNTRCYLLRGNRKLCNSFTVSTQCSESNLTCLHLAVSSKTAIDPGQPQHACDWHLQNGPGKHILKWLPLLTLCWNWPAQLWSSEYSTDTPWRQTRHYEIKLSLKVMQ